MKVILNQEFYDEIQAHYAKSMREDTYIIGDVNCYAFTSSGREDKNIEQGLPIFEFVKPFGTPIYSLITNEVFDSVNLTITKQDGSVIEHSTEVQECECCSNDSSC